MLTAAIRFGLCRRDVADRAEGAAVVVPVDPGHRGDFDGSQAAPWALLLDDLGLEQPDHRLGAGIVVAVADAAERGVDAGCGQALGVRDRNILHAIEGQEAIHPICVPSMFDSLEVKVLYPT